ALKIALLGLGALASAMFWGFSGGGFAMAWAAQVQPVFAPEMNVAGLGCCHAPIAPAGRVCGFCVGA
ncbi:lipase family protein, partial [Nocardia cyriacigeorgica]|uniref:lipase family protein n=1 Tax=Nocardia cyriacigeorgica TaxID=135487 RepID=UPI00245632ED